MYCPECGKFNPDENIACQYCGESLQDSTQPQTQPPTSISYQEYNYEQNYQENIDGSSPDSPSEDPFTDITNKIKNYDYSKIKSGLEKVLDFVKAKKVIFVPIALVLVLFITFLAIGSAVTSPKKIAEKYFQAYIESDYAEMYDYIAVIDSEFIDASAFETYMTNQNSSGDMYQNVEDFTIEELRGPGSDKYVKIFNAEYYDSLTGYGNQYAITLIKQPSKSFLFFDNYKVTLGENFITQNARLEVPNGCVATIDGVELTEKDPSYEEDYGYEAYLISAIFNGPHEVVLKSEMFEDLITEVYFYGDSESYQKVGSLSSMTLKANIASALQKRATVDLQAMYAYAIADKDFSSVEIPVSPSYDDFANCYSNICSSIKGYYPGTGLKSFKITNASIRTSSYSDGNGISVSSSENGITASFSLNYDYNFSEAYQSFDSPEPIIENGSDDSSTTFRYVLIDGAWMLDYISSYHIYY